MRAFLLSIYFRLKYGRDYTLHQLTARELEWARGCEEFLT